MSETVKNQIKLPVASTATVNWLDADGKVTKEEVCPRSMPELLKYLEAEKVKGAAEDAKVRVTIKVKVPKSKVSPPVDTVEVEPGKFAEKPADKPVDRPLPGELPPEPAAPIAEPPAAPPVDDKTPPVPQQTAPVDDKTPPELVEQWLPIFEGTLKECIEGLQGRIMPPVMAMRELHRIISRLMDVSTLKGVLLTVQFEDVGVSGFGLLTESAPVYEDDVKALGEGGDEQVTQFKGVAEKAWGIKYSGTEADKGRIILPGEMHGRPMPPFRGRVVRGRG